MPKLPKLSGKELAKVLVKLGFKFIRQKGSHAIYKKETAEGSVGCVVPMHSEIATGTMLGIIKQAELTKEEFEEARNS